VEFEDRMMDGLPYVDQEYIEEGMKETVDSLLHEEMKHLPSPTAAYLSSLLPPLPPGLLRFEHADGTKKSQFLAAEFQRIAAGKPPTPIDVSRYSLAPPTNDDVSTWSRALDNADSQIEHQYLRQINLELLNNYGANAWRLHNESIDLLKYRLTKILEEYKRAIEDVNRNRKNEQVACGNKLATLEEQWKELVLKNIEIDRACQKLEREIKQAKATAPSPPSSPDAEETEQVS